MLEATKVRISCIEKKVNRTTYKISYTKRVNSEVSGSLTLSLCKNVQKRCAARTKMFFAN